MEKLHIMFDSNEYDKLILLDERMLKLIMEKTHIKITNVQFSELNKITDPEKRAKIEQILTITEKNTEEVSTSFSYSNFKYPKLSFKHGKTVDVIQGNSKQNVNDSLIADAAVSNGCLLITDDSKLFNHMQKNGYDVMNFESFIKWIKDM